MLIWNRRQIIEQGDREEGLGKGGPLKNHGEQPPPAVHGRRGRLLSTNHGLHGDQALRSGGGHWPSDCLSGAGAAVLGLIGLELAQGLGEFQGHPQALSGFFVAHGGDQAHGAHRFGGLQIYPQGKIHQLVDKTDHLGLR